MIVAPRLRRAEPNTMTQKIDSDLVPGPGPRTEPGVPELEPPPEGAARPRYQSHPECRLCSVGRETAEIIMISATQYW